MLAKWTKKNLKKLVAIGITAIILGTILAVVLPARVAIQTSEGVVSIGVKWGTPVYAAAGTNSPTTNTGTVWTNPTQAYTDGGTAATITSAKPSGNNVWGTYGFSLAGYTITQVRVRYDALTGGNEQIRIDVSWDGGTTWSAQQVTALSGTETTYWYDVTAETAWTPAKLANGQLQVRADAYSVGGAGSVSLDWLPVEVTYEAAAPAITVSPTTYNFGVVTESSTPSTTTSYFTITNTSTMITNNTVSVTTTAWSGGVTWTHSDTATPGANTAGLKANKNGTWGTGDVVVKYTSPNVLAASQPANTNWNFGLKLWTPTSFTDGVQKQIVVRVTAASG